MRKTAQEAKAARAGHHISVPTMVLCPMPRWPLCTMKKYGTLLNTATNATNTRICRVMLEFDGVMLDCAEFVMTCSLICLIGIQEICDYFGGTAGVAG